MPGWTLELWYTLLRPRSQPQLCSLLPTRLWYPTLWIGASAETKSTSLKSSLSLVKKKSRENEGIPYPNFLHMISRIFSTDCDNKQFSNFSHVISRIFSTDHENNCKYLYWHRRQHEFRAVSLTMWFQRDAIRARIQLSRECSLSTVPRDAYGKWVCHLLWRRCCRICRLGSTRVWVAPLWRAEACPLTSPAGEGCGACMSVLLSWCRDFGHCHHEKSVLSCLKNSWTSFVGEYVHFVHTENTSFWGKRKTGLVKKAAQCSPNLLETLPPMLEEELPDEPWLFRWCLLEPRLLRLVLEPVS